MDACPNEDAGSALRSRYQGPREQELETRPVVCALCTGAFGHTALRRLALMAQTSVVSDVLVRNELEIWLVSEHVVSIPRCKRSISLKKRRGPSRIEVQRRRPASRVRVARKSGDSLYDRKVARNTPVMSTISGHATIVGRITCVRMNIAVAYEGGSRESPAT